MILLHKALTILLRDVSHLVTPSQRDRNDCKDTKKVDSFAFKYVFSLYLFPRKHQEKSPLGGLANRVSSERRRKLVFILLSRE